jgi:hypothetical protein
MPHFSVTVVDMNGNRSAAQARVVDQVPNVCPICHFTITAEHLNIGFAYLELMDLFFRCTNRRCQRSFIALYGLDRAVSQAGGLYRLTAAYPIEPQTRDVSTEGATLSPSFVRIISQAQAAEERGLDEVTGPGFRKALEFLIKDYAISLQNSEPDEAKRQQAIADIKSIQLMPLIRKY